MTDLVVIEKANIPALFQEGGCDPIIDRLKTEATKFKGDASTAKGRKDIASFAHKFSTSKTYLDGLGKALSDEYRAKIAPINDERNKIKTCCDELRVQVRKPLTDWEDAEKNRVSRIENLIASFDEYLEVEYVESSGAKRALEAMNAIVVDESFEEFELAATKGKTKVIEQLEAKFIVLQNAEKERAEAERLEKEHLDKEQKDREERIAKEAAESATRAAEEKARLEAESKDKAARDAVAAAERATLEAKLATERAEREKREAADRAEQDKKDAVESEKKRQAAMVETVRVEAERLAANKQHRNKIHREAKSSIMEHGLSEEDANIFVTMVKDGLVKHISINY